MKKTNKKEKTDNSETRIVVKMPNEIEINLVQANELKHYELFQWLIILVLPIAAGFWTAYCTTEEKSELFWSALTFTIISLLFIILSFKYRKKVFQNSVQKVATMSNFRNSTNRSLVKKNNTRKKRKFLKFLSIFRWK